MPKPRHFRYARLHLKKMCEPASHDDHHPPPEDELGGGDFCSLEDTPSTDDDKPLD